MCLALAPDQHIYCNVRYPIWFKPNITFCIGVIKSLQIRFVGREVLYIPIDLFCSLIFMPSVTEIQLKKLHALFPRSIRANDVTHWRESSGKSGRTLFNCISVTDGIKINEQNKSIGIGPFYLQTEFEAI